MKKLVTFLTVLALLAVPVSAMAVKAADWELVGYTKLETFWDSVAVNKNLSGPIARSNALQPQNMGRVRFTAQSSRFGLKVNGPEVLGAKTQGYIEIDFDSAQETLQSASNSYIPRMRHAWFRMDWPGGWQLLMGQYWGMFCDFYPETVNDGPYQNHGQSTQRIPQARLTYKTGPWTFSGLAGVAYDTNNDNATGAAGGWNTALFGNVQGLVGSAATASYSGTNQAYLGQRACMPQFQGQVVFEKDLYGKAAFANRPRGFVAEVSAGIQRTQYMNGFLGAPLTSGQGNFSAIGGGSNLFGGAGGGLAQRNTQTLTPWVVQGTLFIPILVTHTDNLAGTASVTIQGQIGQGFSFFGNGADGDNSYFRYDSPGFLGVPGINTPGGNVGPGVNYFLVMNYNRKLTPKYGGYIQGQYYFTNEWYASVVYGFNKSYGINTQDRNFAINPTGRIGGAGSMDVNNFQSYTYATLQDQSNFTGELQANLFWTPSKNLKFGMGYSWLRTTYFQQQTIGRVQSNAGTNHSVRFGGWFFF
jgi:hypothetical protein